MKNNHPVPQRTFGKFDKAVDACWVTFLYLTDTYVVLACTRHCYKLLTKQKPFDLGTAVPILQMRKMKTRHIRHLRSPSWGW